MTFPTLNSLLRITMVGMFLNEQYLSLSTLRLVTNSTLEQGSIYDSHIQALTVFICLLRKGVLKHSFDTNHIARKYDLSSLDPS